MMNLLRQENPDVEWQEVIVETSGDVDRETPLDAQGGVGLFTKELERALLDDKVDVAVHSLKDLPTEDKQDYNYDQGSS